MALATSSSSATGRSTSMSCPWFRSAARKERKSSKGIANYVLRLGRQGYRTAQLVTVRLPDFALRVHGADGVAQACVLLQDRFGLDVNLLLFAARVGTTGRLTPATLAAATERVAQWHAEIDDGSNPVRRPPRAPRPPSCATSSRGWRSAPS
ncbi:DUF2390 domain-containing protein [Mycolicibacterium mageritense]|uniref:DUF2390 domain-containing protein n=1 Tax=Mycolicibacterium mageritense TaxID=53462 RepID=UPI0009DD4653